MRKRSLTAGPGHIPLLSAISEGLIWRDGTGYNAPYVFDGERVSMLDVRPLAKLGLIEVRISGPPVMTASGWAFLARHSS